MPLAPGMPNSALHLRQQRLDHRPQLVINMPRLRPSHPTPPDQQSRSDPTTLKIISLGVLTARRLLVGRHRLAPARRGLRRRLRTLRRPPRPGRAHRHGRRPPGPPADPGKATVATIAGFTAPRTALPNWRDHLALWAEHRPRVPDARPLDECVVDLKAPELEPGPLVDRARLAKIANIAEDDLPDPKCEDHKMPEPQAHGAGDLCGRSPWPRTGRRNSINRAQGPGALLSATTSFGTHAANLRGVTGGIVARSPDGAGRRLGGQGRWLEQIRIRGRVARIFGAHFSSVASGCQFDRTHRNLAGAGCLSASVVDIVHEHADGSCAHRLSESRSTGTAPCSPQPAGHMCSAACVTSRKLLRMLVHTTPAGHATRRSVR